MDANIDLFPFWVQTGEQMTPIHTIDSSAPFAERLDVISDWEQPRGLLFDYAKQVCAYKDMLVSKRVGAPDIDMSLDVPTDGESAPRIVLEFFPIFTYVSDLVARSLCHPTHAWSRDDVVLIPLRIEGLLPENVQPGAPKTPAAQCCESAA